MAHQINDMSEGSIVGAYNALTAAPTTGTYKQGDFIRNTAPAINTFSGTVVYGWICTVSGTPGTWAECSYMANSSGHGIAITAAASAPASGSYLVGDFVRNSAPSVNAFTTSVIFGWLCTVAGSPGTWVACSYLSDVPTATAWTTATLLNSWVTYGATHNTAGYMKDANGFVHLQGAIKNGTTTSGTSLFALPSGYRPAKNCSFAVDANNAYGGIEVESGGNVVAYVVNSTFTSLEGISFKAA